MTNEAVQEFLLTGRMPAGTETFISPTKAFAQDYTGTLFKIKLKSGTISKLENIGVRNRAAGHPYSYLPLAQKGWMKSNAFFKLEKTAINPKHINIGLGNGNTLNIFNDNIINFKVIK